MTFRALPFSPTGWAGALPRRRLPHHHLLQLPHRGAEQLPERRHAAAAGQEAGAVHERPLRHLRARAGAQAEGAEPEQRRERRGPGVVRGVPTQLPPAAARAQECAVRHAALLEAAAAPRRVVQRPGARLPSHRGRQDQGGPHLQDGAGQVGRASRWSPAARNGCVHGSWGSTGTGWAEPLCWLASNPLLTCWYDASLPLPPASSGTRAASSCCAATGASWRRSRTTPGRPPSTTARRTSWRSSRRTPPTTPCCRTPWAKGTPRPCWRRWVSHAAARQFRVCVPHVPIAARSLSTQRR